MTSPNLPSLTHAARHASGGPDAVSPVAIGADLAGLPAYLAGTGRIKRYNPELSVYNLKSSNTQRWRAGLGRAGRLDYNAAPGWLNELWLGDSIMGGCTGLGAGTGTDTTRFDRLHAMGRFHEQIMSEMYGVPVSSTGLVRISDGSHLDARFAFTGDANTKLNGTCFQLSPAGQTTFTTNVAGDTVIVTYYDNFSTASLDISVNGATTGAGHTVVTGANAGKWKNVVLTGLALSVGATIKMTSLIASGGANIQLGFIEVRNRAVGGIAVHNIACSGSKMCDTGTTSWGQTSLTGSGFNAMRQILDPASTPYYNAWDVVHCGWGAFDVYNGTDGSNTNYTQAQMITALEAICAAFPNSDIILHGFPSPQHGTVAQWRVLLGAVYAVADALDLPVLDLEDMFGGGGAVGGGAQLHAQALDADAYYHYLPPVYQMWGRAATELL